MSEEIDWGAVRREFPVTESFAYLNSAAAGPVLRRAASAAQDFYREMMEEGDARWDEWLARREAVRALVARLINAEPDEVAFTTNTSSGMNLIVDALEGLGPVVSSELEFPVTTITWLHRGVRVEMVQARGGEVRAEELLRAADECGAGVISLSHVQYSNGFRADLEEIGGARGSRVFVVNAAQSAGVLPVDVKRMGIDALCATGHKWMLSGYGSGFVYISRRLLEETRPRSIGWLSVFDPFGDRNREFTVRADAGARAEQGCPHFAGIFALGAAAGYMLEIGTENIERRALALNRYLTGRLAEEGWRVLSPLASEDSRSAETLVGAEGPANVVAHLAARGVAVTEKPEGIRVSTHFFNDEADVERLVQALAETRAPG